MAKQNNFFNLYLKVNDKEATQTLNSVGADLKKLRGYTRNLEEGTEKWHDANKKLAEVEKTYDGMKKKQRDFINETKTATETTNDQTAAMQEFGSSASQAFQSLMSGDLIGFQEGMKGVQAGIMGATKAGLAFIATPIGAALAALTGIVLATREWVQYNEAAKEANKVTQQLTQLSGDALDQARIRAQTLEETFGTEFKDNLKSARNLVQAFGISYEEAFETIEQGLIRGGAQSDEFMHSLEEYPKFFAQAGFSAKEFQRILNSGEALGMYDDKLPDAIKEFQLSLSEQTTTSRDALENAFGKKFTDELFGNINKGSITSKDALSLISTEAQTIGLNAQQASQLTADLFRGAGEDAGGALLVLQAVNQALNEEERQLTALEEVTQRNSQANLELAKAKDEALKSDEYAKLSSDVSIAWTKIKTAFYEGLSFIIDTFDSLLQFQTRIFSQITGVVLSLPGIIKSSMMDVKKEVGDVIMTFGKLGTVVERIMDLDFSGAKTAAADFKTSFLKEAGDVASSADDIANKISTTFNKIGEKVDANFERGRKGAGEALALEGADSTTTNNNGGAGPLGDPDKEEEDVDKEAARRATKELAIRAKVEEQLKAWEEERAIQEQLEKFEKDQRAEEEEILKLEAKFAKLEEQAAGEKELLARLEEEKELQIADIRDKYSEERAKKEKAANEKLLAEEKKFKEELIKAEENLQRAKEYALMGGIGALKGFFGEASVIYKMLLGLEKTLAVNEIIVSASSAIAQAQANLAAVPPFIGPLPNPMYPIAASIAAKNILATKITAGTQIASIAATALKGFDKGGFTDMFGIGVKDKSGHEVAGLVHKNEYVVPEIVRKDPEVPQILEYLESKRKKKLGLYADGGDTSENTMSTPASPQEAAVNSRVETLLETLIEATTASRDINFGFEAEMKRQEAANELKRLQDRSKIKKS